MSNVINFHKKPKIYNHKDVMNHLNEPFKVEFEKDGKNYYIVEKEDMQHMNYNIIGMMTGVDVLTGGEYDNGSYINDISDESINTLAKFVVKHNLEGVMEWGVEYPHFPIFFFDQLFNAHAEIESPCLTAEGVSKGFHVKDYSIEDKE